MYIIVNKTTKCIIGASTTVDMVSNGIKTDEVIIGLPVGEDGQFTSNPYDVVEVDALPEGFLPQKYLYINGEFKLNPNFKLETQLQYIEELENKIKLMQSALDEVIMGGM